MANRIINLKFGDGVTANTITDNQIDILKRVAADSNTEAHISGIVLKDYMLESEKYLLEQLGLIVLTNILLDTFSIAPTLSVINEGYSTTIEASNISKAVLAYRIKEIVISAQEGGEDLTTAIINNIKKRIVITLDGTIGCAAALENCSWTALVLVEAYPVFSTDNIKTCTVTFLAIAFSSVSISGETLLLEGGSTTYTASVLPTNSTKRVSAVLWECLNGSINLISGTYIAPYVLPSDSITASITVYGKSYSTSLSILIDVPILSEELNPVMFNIIKLALGLSVELLSVTDLGKFTNSLANSIWLYLALNRASLSNLGNPISFSEFKYFTNVTEVTVSNWNYSNWSSGSHLWMNKLEFPPSLKKFYLYTAIRGAEKIDFSPCSSVYITQREYLANDTNPWRVAFIDIKEINLSTVISGIFSIYCSEACTKPIVLPKLFIETSNNRVYIRYMNSGTLDISKTQLSLPGSIRIYCPNINTINFDSSKKFHCGIHGANIKYFTWDGDASTLTLELPPWMTAVYDYLFSGCTGLLITSLGNLISIGYSSFSGCSQLKNLDFTNIKSVSSYGFSDCASLTCDSFGNITSVGDYGFNNCTSLTNTSLNKISYVGSYGFNGCVGLLISNLSSLNSCGDGYCFLNCVNCTFDSTTLNPNFRAHCSTSWKRELFYNCLEAFPNKEYYIGIPTTTSSTYYIGAGGVWSNTKVKKLIIYGNGIVTDLRFGGQGWGNPIKILDIRLLTNLNYIRPSLWSWSYFTSLLFLNLTKVNRVISIDNNVNTWLGTTMPIYVPDNLVSNYKAASNWSGHANYIFSLSLFKLDAVENGWGTVDDDNNWIVEPEDNEELLATL